MERLLSEISLCGVVAARRSIRRFRADEEPATLGRRLLHDLPSQWEPQALVIIGFPAGATKQRPRKPLDDVAREFA
jgi:hypothetical protein